MTIRWYSPIISFIVLVILSLAITPAFSSSYASLSRTNTPTGQETGQGNDTRELVPSDSTAQAIAQDKISGIFNNLETIGDSYNSGGSRAAALAMVDAGCRASIERAMNTKLFAELKDQLSPDFKTPSFLSQLVSGQINGAGQTSLNQLCAALKGEDIASPNFDQLLKKGLKGSAINQSIAYGQAAAQSSGIPFLSRLEIETGTSEKSWIGSITSVQPLWQDKFDLHHIFAQLSWHKAPDDALEDGQQTKFDTYNAGLAYRYLTPDKSYLYGANVFFDYTPHNDHTRMSLGVDARTSQLAFSANRYIPISTWRSVDAYNEERAAAGWDAQLRGQVPDLPSWTAILKGYEWDGFEEGDKLFGAQAAVEYSPFPAMAVRVGVRDESQGSASLEAALRFNWRFDQPQDLQFKPRTELASVADYVYEKVQRENIIRVKQRQKASARLTVVETSGSNTAQETTGGSSLYLHQNLKMPVTVTVANTAGAIARLQFSDGSLLTLAQNSQATIEPSLITLVSGSMQYVSNGIIHTIAVPGGTIALHGTDIDVVTNGANSSSVRVRDGSVTFTGTTSGAAELAPEELAASVNGVVGSSLPTSDPVYISHTDQISTELDRVGAPQSGQKVAPYPYEPPRIVSETLIPGQQIVLGLKFNDAVTVTSGTPRLHITVKGVSKNATYVSGSGTSDMQFSYTVVPTDSGATNIIVTGFDKNGAAIMGNGKDAVTTIADKTLPLNGTVGDTTPPSGYSVAFTTDPINNANKSAAAIRISNAEVATLYSYTITSSGGGTPVTGSGTVTSATQNITGLNLSGLNDGTLTVSVHLDDVSGNIGSSVTDTVTKDVVAPTGYAASLTTTPINATNKSALGFNITSAEVGATYAYTLSSSGGGTPVTGSGTISSATQSVTGVNASGLTDGTFTLSVTLTDPSGNAGTAVTTSSSGDSSAPSGYGVTVTTSPISNANKTAAAFNITGAEVGTTYAYSITSSGGGTAVTGSGSVSASTQSVTGIDVSGLNDGTLSVAVRLTDPAGNIGNIATGTVTKDVAAPSGYATLFTTAPVNNGNKAAAAIRITSAEVGATYAYTISSSGGGTPVTGSGTISAATQNITGLNLSGLTDGTLTVSVTLTDTSGNAGAAATGTTTKDVSTPSGYAVAFTTDPINNANKTAGAIQITSAEVGTTYAYSITSSGGGTAVTGSGTVSAATQNVIGLNLAGLNDGTLTASVTLTDTSGNAGTAATDTALKDTAAPSGYATAFTTSPINNSNKTAVAFNITAAEVGSTYAYSITSSGGGTAVTGSGTIASATQSVTGVDLSSLTDGTYTLSVTLTDTSGNAGTAATNTASVDTIAPAGYAVIFTTSPINNANKTAGAIRMTSAEIGATYAYTITSSGGGTPVTGSGTVSAPTQNVVGLNLAGLNDGTLTVSVTLTDPSGNTGSATTGTVLKDAAAPAGYTAAFATSPVNNSNKTSAAFDITGGEVGAGYNYTITSSNGGTPVTGSGTIGSATESLTGLDVSGLNDGTLTVSVTLTDTSGNTGSAHTGSALKDVIAPTGYAAAFTTSPVNNANKAAAAFNITGAEVGAGYSYTISSSGGGTNVTGSGTISATTHSVTGVNLSGLNDGTLTVSVTLTDPSGNTGSATTGTALKDSAAPSGYAVAFTTSPINNANKTAGAIQMTSAEVGTTYAYSITSSGGGTPVTGSGTVSAPTQNVVGLNLSGLNDGTLTVSVTLTDPSGNAGSAATGTVLKDAAAPSGYAVLFTTSPINNANKTAGAIRMTSAEVGTTYAYSITSSGGGTPVTGSGTVSAATQNVVGIDLSGLTDGTLTASVTLTDTSGNTGSAVTGTVTKDIVAPTGYATAFTTSPVNNGNKTAAAFNITGAEVGAGYSYTISSSGGGTNVTGSGTVSSATQSVTGVDVSGLTDGTLTVSVTLTDTSGNAGSAVTGTVLKDVTLPSGYAVLFTTSPINNANKTAGAIRMTSAEVGTTYAYSITSSGGGTPVTGSGTVSAGTQNVVGIDLSGLTDGTLTASVTLTDPSGNAGSAVTGTVTKDIVAPSGYAAAFTTLPVNNANKTAAAFDITGGEVGAGYSYTISSSGGGTNVTGSGTIAAATTHMTGLDLSGLNDGTLTVSVTLTDTSGNAGSAATGTATKDIVAPSGYSAAFTTTPANLSNYTAAAFQFAGAEVGAGYSYTISSSGGGTNVTGSGTIVTATDTISGIDLTSLNDGTLTLSVTLTDPSANAGSAATNTATDKDVVAPTITSVTTVDATYEP